MTDLETSAQGLPRDARDKSARSFGRSVIPKELRRRRDSHTQHLEDKLRDQDTIIKKMAMEMEAMRCQMKGKGIAGVENHNEHAHSRRSGSLHRRRTLSLSVTRSFRAGSRTPDSSYQPSRATMVSRYSRSNRSKDLRDVLEESARRQEAQKMSVLQRPVPRGRVNEKVAMPQPRLAAHVPPDRELARLSATPFSVEIENTPLPPGFHQPKFTLYDGKTDPYMHVSHFWQVMVGYRRNDALMCLVFPSSLGEFGLKWFERLLEESIERWQQLAEAFVTRFKTNAKTHKEIDHLLRVKMEPDDFLKAYNAKYWETFNEVLDCPTNLAITQYKHSFPVGHRLRDSLTMNQPSTIELLMQHINEHI